MSHAVPQDSMLTFSKSEERNVLNFISKIIQVDVNQSSNINKNLDQMF